MIRLQTILFLVFITSAQALARDRLRPVIFVIASGNPDLEEIIHSASHDYLLSKVRSLEREIKAKPYERDGMIGRELMAYRPLLDHWRPAWPIPEWVENIIIVEEKDGLLVAFYPRDGGMAIDGKDVVADLRYFVCLLDKNTYAPKTVAGEPKIKAQFPYTIYQGLANRKFLMTRYPPEEGFVSPLNMPWNFNVPSNEKGTEH